MRILYTFTKETSFVKKDIDFFENHYELKKYHFVFKNKINVIWAYLKQFTFLLKNIQKFDIIITQFAGHQSLLPSIFCKVFKAKSVIFVAGTDAAYFPDMKYGNYHLFLNRLATSLSFRFVDYISPCHSSLVFQKYNYYEGGMPAQGYCYFYKHACKKPFTAIPYGFNSELFKRNNQIERDEFSFITIGDLSVQTLYKRKGYDLIIEVAQFFPNCTFTLVGAPEKFNLENLPDNIKLLPYMNQDKLIDLFSKHQFYFQISIMEGFPNALCEAMCCECIPIGSNVSGIPDIVAENGFLLERRNIDELKIIVEKAISTYNKEEFGRRSRNHIVKNYSTSHRHKALDAFIRKIYKS